MATSIIRSKNSVTGGLLISMFLPFIHRIGDKKRSSMTVYIWMLERIAEVASTSTSSGECRGKQTLSRHGLWSPCGLIAPGLAVLCSLGHVSARWGTPG
jgi:hypothetical protein